jgi:hypothetical protein
MSSIVIAGDTSGSVTLQAPAVAGSTVLNLPATSGTIQTSGGGYTTNGVAFASSTSVLATGSALQFNGTSLSVGANQRAILYQDTNGDAVVGSAAGGNVIFFSNGVERARVDNGNFGIGLTNPATKLAVAGGISGTAGLNISGAGWGVLPYVANSLVIDNNAGEARLFATGADATTDGSFLFYTSQTDGGTNERARIDSSGKLLVATTTVIDNARMTIKGSATVINAQTETDGSYVLRVTNAAGSGVGGVVANSSSTSYLTSSDYRLKNTIAPITGALAKVALFKPVTYKWNVDGSDGEGFIAHELAEVCPDAVTGAKDAVDEEGNPKYQGIDTSFLVATLTAAIQEQQALITQLTERITALEAN